MTHRPDPSSRRHTRATAGELPGLQELVEAGYAVSVRRRHSNLERRASVESIDEGDHVETSRAPSRVHTSHSPGSTDRLSANPIHDMELAVAGSPHDVESSQRSHVLSPLTPIPRSSSHSTRQSNTTNNNSNRLSNEIYIEPEIEERLRRAEVRRQIEQRRLDIVDMLETNREAAINGLISIERATRNERAGRVLSELQDRHSFALKAESEGGEIPQVYTPGIAEEMENFRTFQDLDHVSRPPSRILSEPYIPEPYRENEMDPTPSTRKTTWKKLFGKRRADERTIDHEGRLTRLEQMDHESIKRATVGIDNWRRSVGHADRNGPPQRSAQSNSGLPANRSHDNRPIAQLAKSDQDRAESRRDLLEQIADKVEPDAKAEYIYTPGALNGIATRESIPTYTRPPPVVQPTMQLQSIKEEPTTPPTWITPSTKDSPWLEEKFGPPKEDKRRHPNKKNEFYQLVHDREPSDPSSDDSSSDSDDENDRIPNDRRFHNRRRLVSIKSPVVDHGGALVGTSL